MTSNHDASYHIARAIEERAAERLAAIPIAASIHHALGELHAAMAKKAKGCNNLYSAKATLGRLRQD